MDKKRIDIDDLVRQRLSGPEAPMPPHAWNKMSALLDEHMPEPVGAHRSRRFLGLFLLIGALAGSAGYAVWKSDIQKTGEIAALLPANTTPQTGSATGTSTPLMASLTETPVSGTPTSVPNTTSGTTTPLSNRNPQNGPASNNGLPAKSPQRNNNEALAAGTPSGNSAATSRNSPSETNSTIIAGRDKNNNVNPTPTEPTAKPLSVPALPAPVVPAPVYALAPSPFRQLPAGSSVSGATALNAHRLNNLMIGEKALKELNRLDQFTFSTEGLSARKARKALKIWNKTRPVNPSQTAVAATAKPAAALPPAMAAITPMAGAATQSALLVPLANYKVGSRKSASADLTTQEQLSNVVENIKQTAAQTRFYAGALAGISGTLGGPASLQGFHFGLMGMMAFSERFALVGELRYLRRFNGSSNLRDDYYKTNRVSESAFTRDGQAYNVYRYDLDSNVSVYKFEGLNTFQLPLYARFSFNRISLLAGLNLSYHMRTDVEQGGARIATISRYDTLLTSATPAAAISRPATIGIDDFGARFGIGYVAGAVYQLSPAINLDFRITQQLWDNLKGRSEGARTVSKTYFQLPTLQLSVGYRFQQRATQSRKR